MVRVITNDDLCCEITLNSTAYNSIKISAKKGNTALTSSITALDLSSRVKNGEILHSIIGMHEIDEKAHKALFNQKVNLSELSGVAISGDYNDLNNKPSIPEVNNGTLTITQNGDIKGTFSANQSENTLIELNGGEGGGGQRNIGEIVTSTIPLTDAGLHLLDGALISGSGIYSDFVSYVADLYENNSTANYFTTETAWQQSAATYEVCGKFVYDSVNNTVRLPKYSNKIYTGGGNAPVIGNGLSLGLTNGIFNTALTGGTLGDYYNNNNSYGQAIGTYGLTGNNVSFEDKSVGITTDPANSGVITDLSEITTSLDGYYYIVVATSAKTEIEVDIDEIVADLNGKADADLSNSTVPHITDTYVNGTSGYRIWSDGYCEQWGSTGLQGGDTYIRTTITFLKRFADVNYNIQSTPNKYSSQNGLSAAYPPFIFTKNTDNCIFGGFCWTDGFDWKASGYLAQGQY